MYIINATFIQHAVLLEVDNGQRENLSKKHFGLKTWYYNQKL